MCPVGRPAALLALAGAVLLPGAGPAAAQEAGGPPATSATAAPERLVNLDTPAPFAPPGEVRLRAETRLFGGREDLSYTSLSVHYGLGGPERASRDEVVLRYVAGREKTSGTPAAARIRHGGSDLELLAKLHLPARPDLALLLGLTLPNTASQSGELHGSAQVLGRFPVAPAAALYAGARLQLIESNTLVGIGGGFSADVAPNLRLLGDVTAVVAGDNTHDVATGARDRATTLWGLSAQYRSPGPDPRFRAEVGVTNALGVTTGYSLTPGLDDSTALVLGLSFRL